MDTSTHPVGKRRHRTLEEKQQILAEATAAGACVAAVARKHGVNANLVFAWLRLRQAGLLQKAVPSVPLLPVTVTTPTVLPDKASRPSSSRRRRSKAAALEGHVAVEFPGGVTVRVHGYVEPSALSAVFAALSSR